ncbi:hypothetical protein DVH05_003448 [Phytophthora capsici]|nr:hypothetical protein DVH05_003448 [Phytophthora capsici]
MMTTRTPLVLAARDVPATSVEGVPATTVRSDATNNENYIDNGDTEVDNGDTEADEPRATIV